MGIHRFPVDSLHKGPVMQIAWRHGNVARDHTVFLSSKHTTERQNNGWGLLNLLSLRDLLRWNTHIFINYAGVDGGCVAVMIPWSRYMIPDELNFDNERKF